MQPTNSVKLQWSSLRLRGGNKQSVNFKNQPYSQLWRLITAVLNQLTLVRSPRKHMKIKDKQKQGNNLCKRESWCATKVKLHLGNTGQVLHDYLSPSLNSVWFASSSTNECKIQIKPMCHISPFVQPYLPRAQVMHCNALNANRSRMQKTERWQFCLLRRLLCYICTLNLIQAIICLLYVQCSWWMIPTGLTARTRSLIWRMCCFGGKSEGCKSGSGGCL